jgi:hypothetical protein
MDCWLTSYISDHKRTQYDLAEENQTEEMPIIFRVGEKPDNPGYAGRENGAASARRIHGACSSLQCAARVIPTASTSILKAYAEPSVSNLNEEYEL